MYCAMLCDQGYRSTDHVPLHFTTPTAREKPRKKGFLVIGEVLGVTAGGIAMVGRRIDDYRSLFLFRSLFLS